MHDYNNRIQDGTIFFIPLVVVSIFVAHIVFVAFVVIAFGLFRRFRFRRGRPPPCCRTALVRSFSAPSRWCFLYFMFSSCAFSVFFVFVVAVFFRCCRRIVVVLVVPFAVNVVFIRGRHGSFIYSVFHILVRAAI